MINWKKYPENPVDPVKEKNKIESNYGEGTRLRQISVKRQETRIVSPQPEPQACCF
jgi:hypothetical protein